MLDWEQSPYRPFCSERCKLIDLGKWASDEYRVPDEASLDKTEPKENQNGESSENGKKSDR